MSSTRTAQPGAPFRQERFASSPEFERGLKANLVAKRAELLESDEDRELVWWLQQESHSPGGLRALVVEMMERNPESHISPLMRAFGIGPQARWSGSQAEEVFKEIGVCCWDLTKAGYKAGGLDNVAIGHFKDGSEALTIEGVIECVLRKARTELPTMLERACLDPTTRLDDTRPRFFQGLRTALLDLMRSKAETSRQSRVVTVVGRKVDEAFRFAWKTRGLVIVNGNPRIGKSHAAHAWCAEHPGIARIADVPSASDELSFLRSIAISLGISLPLKAKTTDLRIRIEEVLQSRQLLLCLDEAHYLFPHSNYREALPQRINWLMTALVNHRVPVVLVVTPQFFSHQKRIEEKTSWTGGQFTGRVKRYFELPPELSKEDLVAVARRLLPKAEQKVIEVLADVAVVSNKHLAAIESVVDTARFMAEEAGRSEVEAADIRAAMSEVMPSEVALTKAVNGPSAQGKRRGRRAAVLPPEPRRDAAADLPLELMETRPTKPEPFSLPANHRQEGVLIGG